MNILIAPDSFKGTLTAMEVAENIEKGILSEIPDANTYKLPLADGGEGTVQSLVDAKNGKIIYKEVTGPLGNKAEAYFGVIDDQQTAVIEMATASGLPLVPKEKADPRITTSYGTGELIKAALDLEVNEIIIGIGGSATNDGGVGMAQALGIQFYDDNGDEIGYGGKELKNIQSIEMDGLDPRINEVTIKVACDVTNPLYGKDGAAYIYGPQKGATPEIVKELDKNLRYFAQVIKRELGEDVQNIPGAGAAGGLGAGLVVFLNGKLQRGIDIVLEASQIDNYLIDTDLVITGEGQIDGQTVKGKTPIGVAKRAKRYGLPVIALAGSIGDDADLVIDEGIDAVFSIISQPLSEEEIFNSSEKWLQNNAKQIIKLYFLNK